MPCVYAIVGSTDDRAPKKFAGLAIGLTLTDPVAGAAYPLSFSRSEELADGPVRDDALKDDALEEVNEPTRDSGPHPMGMRARSRLFA